MVIGLLNRIFRELLHHFPHMRSKIYRWTDSTHAPKKNSMLGFEKLVPFPFIIKMLPFLAFIGIMARLWPPLLLFVGIPVALALFIEYGKSEKSRKKFLKVRKASFAAYGEYVKPGETFAGGPLPSTVALLEAGSNEERH